MITNGKNLAFIVGNYKSGSTWLLNALSCHPWVRGVSETRIFHYSFTEELPTCTNILFHQTSWSEGGLQNLLRQRCGEWRRTIVRLWKPTLCLQDRPTTLLDLSILNQLKLKKNLLRSRDKEEYCQQFFHFLYNRLQPFGYLIEKTPNHVSYVPYIRSIFPESKLIIIYRDGRDVVVSERLMKANLPKQPWSAKRPWTFAESIHNWRQLVEDQLRYTEQYGIYTCAYEALLQEGERVLQELLEFLSIPSDLDTVKDMLYRSSFPFLTGRQIGEEDPTSFYRKGVAGDWKYHFTEDDKKLFKEIAGDVLIKLGYEKDFNW